MTIHRKDQGLQNMIGQKVVANGTVIHVSKVFTSNGITVRFVVDRPIIVSGSRVMQVDHLNLAIGHWSKLDQRLIRVGQRIVFEGLISNYERTNGTVGVGIPELVSLAEA